MIMLALLSENKAQKNVLAHIHLCMCSCIKGIIFLNYYWTLLFVFLSTGLGHLRYLPAQEKDWDLLPVVDATVT